MSILRKKNLKEYLDDIETDSEFLNELLEGLSDEKAKEKVKLFGYDSEMEKIKENASAFLMKKKKHIFKLTKLEEKIIE